MRGTNAFIRSVTIRVATPTKGLERQIPRGDSSGKGEDAKSIAGEPFL